MANTKREVIYVDPEDDITSVIDKVKLGSGKVVAIVPGKRLGALQSAVNLRLLQRAAQAIDRKLVIVSEDKSLMKIAGGVGIYMAKNLQTRPAVPLIDDAPSRTSETEEIPTEDIASLKKKIQAEAASSEDENNVIEEEIEDNAKKMAAQSAATEKQKKIIEKAKEEQEDKIKELEKKEEAKKAKKAKEAEPDINKFRKKVIAASLVLLLLLSGFIWAILQKPSAVVIIRSQTSNYQYAQSWVLDPGVDSDATQKSFKTKEYKGEENLSADFSATGEKDIGERATGQVTIINCNDSAISIASGAAFAANGKNYLSNGAVNIPGSNFFSSGQCKEDGKATVSVTAVQSGESFNQPAAAYQIAGSPTSVSASGSAMTGGSTNVVKIVQQSDIDAAKQKLAAQNTADYKNKLSVTVDKNYQIIEDSFNLSQSDASSNVQAGQQAPGGKVEMKINYSLQAYSKDELKTLISKAVNQEIAATNQKIYESSSNKGELSLSLDNERSSSGAKKYKVSMLLSTGPAINEEELKAKLVSRKKGEITTELESIKGVSRVDVSISPFWKQKTPSDPAKITIKLKVDE
jgi:hypothetical protein